MIPETATTTIATFNIRGFQIGGVPLKKRSWILFEYLNSTHVDELHLQEVYTYGILRHLSNALNFHFPHVAFEKGAFGPKAGLVSFYRRKPILVTFHRLPTPSVSQLDWMRIIPYIHKGILMTVTAQNELRFNLHLNPDHSGEWKHNSPSTRLIAHQLDVATELVLQFNQTKEQPFVLVGDFNLPTDTPTYHQFVDRLGIIDAMKNDSRPTFHRTFLPANSIPRQIDHILVWQNGRSANTDLILNEPRNGMYASDHMGIMTTLEH